VVIRSYGLVADRAGHLDRHAQKRAGLRCQATTTSGVTAIEGSAKRHSSTMRPAAYRLGSVRSCLEGCARLDKRWGVRFRHSLRIAENTRQSKASPPPRKWAQPTLCAVTLKGHDSRRGHGTTRDLSTRVGRASSRSAFTSLLLARLHAVLQLFKPIQHEVDLRRLRLLSGFEHQEALARDTSYCNRVTMLVSVCTHPRTAPWAYRPKTPVVL
jgi:hypothetical protein